jgi:hypothetical protein
MAEEGTAEELAAKAVTLLGRQDISMANKLDVAYLLKAHYASQTVAVVITPKCNAGGKFAVELMA